MNVPNQITRVTGASEQLISPKPARIISVIPETATTNSTVAFRDAGAVGGGSTAIFTLNSLTGGLVGRQGVYFGDRGVGFGNGITATVGTTTADVYLVVWSAI